SCPMPACAQLWLHPFLPTGVAQRRCGGRVRRRWRRASPIMSGTCEEACCSAWRRWHSYRWAQQRYQLLIAVWKGWGVLRCRPSRQGGLENGFRESACPADCPLSDGSGEVPKYYPQPGGTRSVEALHERCVDLPAAHREHLLHGL